MERVDERCDSLLDRLMKVYMHGTFEQSLPTVGIDKYFGKEWPTRHLYHLMINSKVGDETVLRIILDEVSALNAHAVAQTN